MSHFVFGTISSGHPSVRESVGSLFDVCWGTELCQSSVLEMLSPNLVGGRMLTPFMLTGVGDDTADRLVSPYRSVRLDVVAERVGEMIRWLESVRAGAPAELWMTEGYDDAFEEYGGNLQFLLDHSLMAICAASQLPSLRLKFESRW